MPRSKFMMTFEERCEQILKEKTDYIMSNTSIPEGRFEVYMAGDPPRRLNGLLGDARRNGQEVKFTENSFGRFDPRTKYLYDPKDVFEWLDSNGMEYWPEMKDIWKPDPIKYPYQNLLTDARLEKAIEGMEELKREVECLQKDNESLRKKLLHGDDDGLHSRGMILSNTVKFNRFRGIYFLVRSRDIVYVGQSVNILARIGAHVADKEFDSYSFIEVPDGQDLGEVERAYISKFKPEYNQAHNWGQRLISV